MNKLKIMRTINFIKNMDILIKQISCLLNNIIKLLLVNTTGSEMVDVGTE